MAWRHWPLRLLAVLELVLQVLLQLGPPGVVSPWAIPPYCSLALYTTSASNVRARLQAYPAADAPAAQTVEADLQEDHLEELEKVSGGAIARARSSVK